MWFVLLTVHLLGNVGYNLLLRKSVLARVDKWLLATILQTGIAIPAIVIACFYPFKFQAFDTFDVFLFISTAALTILIQTCNVKALQYLEAGVFSVIYSTRIILASFLGTFLLAEDLTYLQIIGGLLIFSSVVIVRQKQKFSLTKLGILFGLGTAMSFSFLNVTEKLLNQRVGFFEYFIPESILAAVIMWIVIFIRKTPVSLSGLVQPSNMWLMGLRALSGFGFSGAIVYGPIALSGYISNLSIILIVFCGALFLNERDFLKSKIIATIIAFVGLTLILVKDF